MFQNDSTMQKHEKPQTQITKPIQTGLHMVNRSVDLSNTVKHKDRTQENIGICKQSIDRSKAKSQESDAISHQKGLSQEKTTTNNRMLISPTWTRKKRQLTQGHSKATEFHN